MASSFTASLNGIALPETAINIDDFSGEKRTIHVVVTQNELQEIFSNNNFPSGEKNYFGINKAVIKYVLVSINTDEVTTAVVVALPTPSAPPKA